MRQQRSLLLHVSFSVQTRQEQTLSPALQPPPLLLEITEIKRTHSRMATCAHRSMRDSLHVARHLLLHGNIIENLKRLVPLLELRACVDGGATAPDGGGTAALLPVELQCSLACAALVQARGGSLQQQRVVCRSLVSDIGVKRAPELHALLVMLRVGGGDHHGTR